MWRIIYDVINELIEHIVECSFLFPLVQKVLKLTTKTQTYNRKHKWVFFLNTVYLTCIQKLMTASLANRVISETKNYKVMKSNYKQ